MIKSNALRQGNIVKSNKNYTHHKSTEQINYVVDEIKDFKVNLTQMSGNSLTMKSTHLEYSEIEGIPLTEEWLIKFGFKKEYEDNNTFDFNGWSFDFDKEECMRSLFDGSNFIDIIPKYVHQLQNLYFALTGEELTIKE